MRQSLALRSWRRFEFGLPQEHLELVPKQCSPRRFTGMPRRFVPDFETIEAARNDDFPVDMHEVTKSLGQENPPLLVELGFLRSSIPLPLKLAILP